MGSGIGVWPDVADEMSRDLASGPSGRSCSVVVESFYLSYHDRLAGLSVVLSDLRPKQPVLKT